MPGWGAIENVFWRAPRKAPAAQLEDGKDILGIPFFFDVFRSTERVGTDCLSKRCPPVLPPFCRQGNESACQNGPSHDTTPHFFTDYSHTSTLFPHLELLAITSNFMGLARLWCHPYSALSGIALERGFKGTLHLGTVSVYVITLGFTLCLVLAVKAGQDRVTRFLPLGGFGGLFWARAVC